MMLTSEQLNEVKAICDQICQTLETDDEYTYDLDERRGKAGCFPDEVWDQAMVALRTAGFNAHRVEAVITVRKA